MDWAALSPCSLRSYCSSKLDLCVHPGELVALGALIEQAVLGIEMNAEMGAAETVIDHTDAKTPRAPEESARFVSALQAKHIHWRRQTGDPWPER